MKPQTLDVVADALTLLQTRRVAKFSLTLPDGATFSGEFDKSAFAADAPAPAAREPHPNPLFANDEG